MPVPRRAVRRSRRSQAAAASPDRRRGLHGRAAPPAAPSRLRLGACPCVCVVCPRRRGAAICGATGAARAVRRGMEKPTGTGGGWRLRLRRLRLRRLRLRRPRLRRLRRLALAPAALAPAALAPAALAPAAESVRGCANAVAEAAAAAVAALPCAGIFELRGAHGPAV